jgi:hypothetical protein
LDEKYRPPSRGYQSQLPNGRIAISSKEAGRMINRGPAAGARALTNLCDWGWLAITDGAMPKFNTTSKNKNRKIPNTKGKAILYRITMFANDFTNEPPTNDWQRYETEPNDRAVRRAAADKGSAPSAPPAPSPDINAVVDSYSYAVCGEPMAKGIQTLIDETSIKTVLSYPLANDQSVDF